jgi:protein-L-isoaspartate(D-aspartate) O-methyltransferase
MVESQVRPSDVTDRRITSAMMSLPRERFVPARVAQLAYMDGALPLSASRGLMAPRDFARLVQLAGVNETDRVLDVGSAGGYSAAVLSKLAREVVALESDATIQSNAKAVMSEVGISNVTFASGPFAAGWPDGGPYDVIVVEGAIEAIPDALRAQLTPSGRLVAVLTHRGVGRAALVAGGSGEAAPRVTFEISAPPLPGFAAAAKAFEF